MIGLSVELPGNQSSLAQFPIHGPNPRFPAERHHREALMIRKLASGEYRLFSRKKNPKTGKRRNLGTFKTREAAMKHERAVQYFKHH